jgi:hypothetical protein
MDWEREEREIAARIIGSEHLTFLARELGFRDHTMIHEAVKPILAKYIARVVRSEIVRDRRNRATPPTEAGAKR